MTVTTCCALEMLEHRLLLSAALTGADAAANRAVASPARPRAFSAPPELVAGLLQKTAHSPLSLIGAAAGIAIGQYAFFPSAASDSDALDVYDARSDRWSTAHLPRVRSRPNDGQRRRTRQRGKMDLTPFAMPVYDPYGKFTTLTSTWTQTTDGKEWQSLFQGGRWMADINLYQMGFRYLDPETQRWISQDPNSWLYVDGENLYWCFDDNPISLTDPRGAAPVLPNPGGNWGPINPVTGQPQYLPEIPGGWKPVPSPNYDPNDPTSRPGKWVPKDPKAAKAPGSKGGVPQGSWDPRPSKKHPNGHGDMDDGCGKPGHVDENGNPISAADAHDYTPLAPPKPSPSDARPLCRPGHACTGGEHVRGPNSEPFPWDEWIDDIVHPPIYEPGLGRPLQLLTPSPGVPWPGTWWSAPVPVPVPVGAPVLIP